MNQPDDSFLQAGEESGAILHHGGEAGGLWYVQRHCPDLVLTEILTKLK